MKYFKQDIEYPDISNTILPLGTKFSYISSMFLNGFVNYSKPFKAYLLHRYENNADKNKLSVQLFNQRLGSERYHTDLGMHFQDDILLLSKSTSGEYWFYWFDRDVSDCQIGRFRTDDTEEQVLLEFQQYVYDIQKHINYVDHKEMPIEIQTDKFNGWISF